MFNNDAELMPRTYAIKSYRKNDSLTLLKVLKYLIYLLILVVISGVTILAMNHLI